MLNLIGLGLNSEKDITLKALEIIKKSDIVYLENYTSKLNCSINDLEKLYNKKITAASRKLVEESDEIIKNAKTKNVSLLVIGDPFSATTHIELFLRAKKEGIKVNVAHNASILNAIGITGLQIYKFGKTASIPLNNENIESPYDILVENSKINAHTLFLLDLDPLQNKFLSINDALRYLLKAELKKNKKIISENTNAVACSKIGTDEQDIKYGKIKDLLKFKFTQFPQCLIVPSKLHFVEEEALNLYKID